MLPFLLGLLLLVAEKPHVDSAVAVYVPYLANRISNNAVTLCEQKRALTVAVMIRFGLQGPEVCAECVLPVAVVRFE